MYGVLPCIREILGGREAKLVPAAAVRRALQTLFGITGLKEFVGGRVGEV